MTGGKVPFHVLERVTSFEKIGGVLGFYLVTSETPVNPLFFSCIKDNAWQVALDIANIDKAHNPTVYFCYEGKALEATYTFPMKNHMEALFVTDDIDMIPSGAFFLFVETSYAHLHVDFWNLCRGLQGLYIKAFPDDCFVERITEERVDTTVTRQVFVVKKK
jgi:hypothetical protein